MTATFDVLIHSAFYHWAVLVDRFKLLFFLIPVFITAFLTVGFKNITQQTTIDPKYVFSPAKAPWQFESAVLKEHWPLNEQEFWPGKSYDYEGYVDVIAAGKMNAERGRPNMLHTRYLYELERINEYIIHNLTVPVAHNGKTYHIGFTDLCMSYDWKCYMNDHLTMLMPKHRWGNFSGKMAEFADEIINTEVKITYPIGYRGTEPIYFGALIGAPHLTDEEGHFNYVRAVRLTFNVREEKVGNISYLWRKKVANYLSDTANPPSDLLEFGMFHNESLPEGLQQVADTLTPRFVLTCVILFTLCGFSSVVVMKREGFLTVDWVRSKPSVALAGLICPLLSILSGFGMILWMGCLYNAIVNVSPFIVFCIGVDDMFIMSAAWHRTNSELTVRRRLAETLSEAAVAISITSLTDMITFGIGCFTTLPSVQMFCLYTFMGITFTYIYQLTFFAAVMAYAGEWENQNLHVLTFQPAITFEQADTLAKKLLMTGSITSNRSQTNNSEKVGSALEPIPIIKISEDGRKYRDTQNNKKQHCSFVEKIRKAITYIERTTDSENIVSYLRGLPSHHNRETFISKVFREYYGPFLLTSTTKKAVLFIYLLYIILAILGCTMVEEGLNPKFLIKKSFYLFKFYSLMDETFWTEGLQMQVVVNSPPNFFNSLERRKFQQVIDAFENTHYTMKHNATMFWLTAFERKLKEDDEVFKIPMPNSTEEWYERCRDWLISAGGRRLWEKDMVWGTNITDRRTYYHLYAFRLQLGLRNYNTPTDHMRSAKLMRATAAKFPEYNITTFHEYYPFADQYIELKPALIRNCILALIAMLLVSFIMIPNYGAAFVIAGAICSIDIGVIGYMTFWGVRLESVSMITVIMSIGFAVDLSAHIGYAYVKAEGDKDKKAVQALETLGWPVFLVLVSTFIFALFVFILTDIWEKKEKTKHLKAQKAKLKKVMNEAIQSTRTKDNTGEGAFSTIMGIMVLATVDAYIVQIFFKTVFLVIMFSMAHGLVFLPIFLTIVLPHAKLREEKTADDMESHNSKSHEKPDKLSNFQTANSNCSNQQFSSISNNQTQQANTPVLEHTERIKENFRTSAINQGMSIKISDSLPDISVNPFEKENQIQEDITEVEVRRKSSVSLNKSL